MIASRSARSPARRPAGADIGKHLDGAGLGQPQGLSGDILIAGPKPAVHNPDGHFRDEREGSSGVRWRRPDEERRLLFGIPDRRPRRCPTGFSNWRGEPRVCAMVVPPTPEQEDRRRTSRERAILLKERVRHVNRIKGLLASQGIIEVPTQMDATRRLTISGVGTLRNHRINAIGGRTMQRRLIASIALAVAICLPLCGEAAFPLPKERQVPSPHLRTIQNVPSYTLTVSIAYGSGNCWAIINFKPYGSTTSGVTTGLAGAGKLDCYIYSNHSYSSNNTFLLIPTGASSFSVNIIAPGEPSWTGTVTASGSDLRGTVGPSGTEYRIQIFQTPPSPPPTSPPPPPPPMARNCLTPQTQCSINDAITYTGPGGTCYCNGVRGTAR
jgi:hypothetical protein